MKNLYPLNTNRERAIDAMARFRVNIAIASELSAPDTLAIESLAIDAAATEIAQEIEAARLESEIRGLRNKLRGELSEWARAELNERLDVARLDLLQVECEMNEVTL